MTIEWTQSGGSLATLGNDAAQQTILIRQWTGQAQVQQRPRFRAANPFAASRNNIAGVFAFTSTKSWPSLIESDAAFFGEYARLGQQGVLTIKQGSSSFISYTTAILQSVTRGNKEGVRLEIEYQFVIGAGTLITP